MATLPISVTPSLTPYQTFWGLGDGWWKQIYDGKHHVHGPMVFDKGLHKGPVEPGFYNSLKKACEVASESLKENVLPFKPTTAFYKQIHKIVCGHFDGKSTVMTAEDAGKFWVGEYCRSPIPSLFDTLPQKDREKIIKESEEYRKIATTEILYSGMDSEDRKKYLMKKGYDEEAYLKKRDAARAFFKDCSAKIAKINSYIEQRSKEVGSSKSIASLSEISNLIYVYYHCKDSEVDSVVEKLFTEFSENIAKADSKEKKIRCIADLYQMLEWTHPFRDGQGRTDLVLLAILLCAYGLNPSILEEPYVSTLCGLDEWADYLEKGTQKWLEEPINAGNRAL